MGKVQANQGTLSDTATRIEDFICENEIACCAVKQSLNSVVREIRTPRCVGVGTTQWWFLLPGARWNWMRAMNKLNRILANGSARKKKTKCACAKEKF